MPYRTDARDEAALAARLREAEAALERAELAVVAAVDALSRLEARVQARRRALEEAVAAAEDDERRAIYLGLAAADGENARIRDAVRAQAAVRTLERALAHKGSTRPPPRRVSKAPPPIAQIREALSEARLRRAKLAAAAPKTLARARLRLAEAERERDAAEEALTDARAQAGRD